MTKIQINENYFCDLETDFFEINDYYPYSRGWRDLSELRYPTSNSNYPIVVKDNQIRVFKYNEKDKEFSPHTISLQTINADTTDKYSPNLKTIVSRNLEDPNDYVYWASQSLRDFCYSETMTFEKLFEYIKGLGDTNPYNALITELNNSKTFLQRPSIVLKKCDQPYNSNVGFKQSECNSIVDAISYGNRSIQCEKHKNWYSVDGNRKKMKIITQFITGIEDLPTYTDISIKNLGAIVDNKVEWSSEKADIQKQNYYSYLMFCSGIQNQTDFERLSQYSYNNRKILIKKMFGKNRSMVKPYSNLIDAATILPQEFLLTEGELETLNESIDLFNDWFFFMSNKDNKEYRDYLLTFGGWKGLEFEGWDNYKNNDYIVQSIWEGFINMRGGFISEEDIQLAKCAILNVNIENKKKEFNQIYNKKSDIIAKYIQLLQDLNNLFKINWFKDVNSITNSNNIDTLIKKLTESQVILEEKNEKCKTKTECTDDNLKELGNVLKEIKEIPLNNPEDVISPVIQELDNFIKGKLVNLNDDRDNLIKWYGYYETKGEIVPYIFQNYLEEGVSNCQYIINAINCLIGIYKITNNNKIKIDIKKKIKEYLTNKKLNPYIQYNVIPSIGYSFQVKNKISKYIGNKDNGWIIQNNLIGKKIDNDFHTNYNETKTNLIDKYSDNFPWLKNRPNEIEKKFNNSIKNTILTLLGDSISESRKIIMDNRFFPKGITFESQYKLVDDSFLSKQTNNKPMPFKGGTPPLSKPVYHIFTSDKNMRYINILYQNKYYLLNKYNGGKYHDFINSCYIRYKYEFPSMDKYICIDYLNDFELNIVLTNLFTNPNLNPRYISTNILEIKNKIQNYICERKIETLNRLNTIKGKMTNWIVYLRKKKMENDKDINEFLFNYSDWYEQHKNNNFEAISSKDLKSMLTNIAGGLPTKITIEVTNKLCDEPNKSFFDEIPEAFKSNNIIVQLGYLLSEKIDKLLDIIIPFLKDERRKIFTANLVDAGYWNVSSIITSKNIYEIFQNIMGPKSSIPDNFKLNDNEMNTILNRLKQEKNKIILLSKTELGICNNNNVPKDTLGFGTYLTEYFGIIDIADTVIPKDFLYFKDNEREKYVANSKNREIFLRIDILEKMANSLWLSKLDDGKLLDYNNFIIYGNPGTGKTTICKQLSKIFCGIGACNSGEIRIIMPEDLLSGYVGKSGKNTNEFLLKNQGNIIYIDEAHQLYTGEGKKGAFGKEVITALMNFITGVKENTYDKTVVILSGYKGAMKKLLDMDEGLSRRFPISKRIDIPPVTDNTISDILGKKSIKVNTTSASPPNKMIITKDNWQVIISNIFSNNQIKQYIQENINLGLVDQLINLTRDLNESKKFNDKNEEQIENLISTSYIHNWDKLNMVNLKIGKDKKIIVKEDDNYEECENCEQTDRNITCHDIKLKGGGRENIKNNYKKYYMYLGPKFKYKNNIVHSQLGGYLVKNNENGKKYLKTKKIIIPLNKFREGHFLRVNMIGGETCTSPRDRSDENIIYSNKNRYDNLYTILALIVPESKNKYIFEYAKKLYLKEIDPLSLMTMNKIELINTLENSIGINSDIVESRKMDRLDILALYGIRESNTEDIYQKLITVYKKNCYKITTASINEDKFIGSGQLKLFQEITKYCGNDTSQSAFTNIILYGPPGTGKTYLGMEISKIFCKFGKIYREEIKEVMPNQLLGSGHDASQTTQSILNRYQGGVIFIDEAHQLIPEYPGSPKKEVILALMNFITQVNKKQRLPTIIILAGYEGPIHKLLEEDDGLSRRFPINWRFLLEPWSTEELFERFNSLDIEINYDGLDTPQTTIPEQLKILWKNINEKKLKYLESNYLNFLEIYEIKYTDTDFLKCILDWLKDSHKDCWLYINEEVNSGLITNLISYGTRMSYSSLDTLTEDAVANEEIITKIKNNKYIYWYHIITYLFEIIWNKEGALINTIELKNILDNYVKFFQECLPDNKKRYQRKYSQILLSLGFLDPKIMINRSDDELKNMLTVTIGINSNLKESQKLTLSELESLINNRSRLGDKILIEFSKNPIKTCPLQKDSLIFDKIRNDLTNTLNNDSYYGFGDMIGNNKKNTVNLVSAFVKQILYNGYQSEYIEGEEVMTYSLGKIVKGVIVSKPTTDTEGYQVKIGNHNQKFSINNLRNFDAVSNPKGQYLNFLITGCPGTGKTIIGRKMAKIFCALGVTYNDKFAIKTKDDFIKGFVGQTAVATKKVLYENEGGIIFIDEAHQLIENDENNRSGYEKEALDTIMNFMTAVEKGDAMPTIIIMAGYPNKINKLLEFDPGLDRRFPPVFRLHLDGYTQGELLEIFKIKTKWIPQESEKKEITINKADFIYLDEKNGLVKGFKEGNEVKYPQEWINVNYEEHSTNNECVNVTYQASQMYDNDGIGGVNGTPNIDEIFNTELNNKDDLLTYIKDSWNGGFIDSMIKYMEFNSRSYINRVNLNEWKTKQIAILKGNGFYTSTLKNFITNFDEMAAMKGYKKTCMEDKEEQPGGNYQYEIFNPSLKELTL